MVISKKLLALIFLFLNSASYAEESDLLTGDKAPPSAAPVAPQQPIVQSITVRFAIEMLPLLGGDAELEGRQRLRLVQYLVANKNLAAAMELVQGKTSPVASSLSAQIAKALAESGKNEDAKKWVSQATAQASALTSDQARGEPLSICAEALVRLGDDAGAAKLIEDMKVERVKQEILNSRDRAKAEGGRLDSYTSPVLDGTANLDQKMESPGVARVLLALASRELKSEKPNKEKAMALIKDAEKAAPLCRDTRQLPVLREAAELALLAGEKDHCNAIIDSCVRTTHLLGSSAYWKSEELCACAEIADRCGRTPLANAWAAMAAEVATNQENFFQSDCWARPAVYFFKRDQKSVSDWFLNRAVEATKGNPNPRVKAYAAISVAMAFAEQGLETPPDLLGELKALLVDQPSASLKK